MAIKLHCPSCKSPISAPESYHRKTMKCPKCNVSFTALTDEERQREKKRLRLEEDKRRQSQKRMSEQRRSHAQELEALKEIKWECPVCNKGLSELHIRKRLAVRHHEYVYCRQHVPKTTDCPDCGREVSKHASACPHCGRPFTDNNKTSRKKKHLGLLISGAVAIIVLSAVLGILVSRNYSAKKAKEVMANRICNEAKRLENQKEYSRAVRKYQEVIDIIKSSDHQSEAFGRILVAAESGKNRAARNTPFTVTVDIRNNTLVHGIYPKWSVDHELRVNGKLVDTITNKSTTASFEGIKVKAGDKITARSLWKNAYGTALGFYERVEDEWPIVQLGKTSYSVVIRE